MPSDYVMIYTTAAKGSREGAGNLPTRGELFDEFVADWPARSEDGEHDFPASPSDSCTALAPLASLKAAGRDCVDEQSATNRRNICCESDISKSEGHRLKGDFSD
jgi:hypothetical protein